METLPDNSPLDWREILEESEAELEAGLTVPGELVHRELREHRPARGEERDDPSRSDRTALIDHTPRALRQIRELRHDYENLEPIEAIRGLDAALRDAEGVTENDPSAGLPAPRPHPQLARLGRAWVRAGRNWIAYGAKSPPMIVAIFYDAADVPNRI